MKIPKSITPECFAHGEHWVLISPKNTDNVCDRLNRTIIDPQNGQTISISPFLEEKLRTQQYQLDDGIRLEHVLIRPLENPNTRTSVILSNIKTTYENEDSKTECIIGFNPAMYEAIKNQQYTPMVTNNPASLYVIAISAIVMPTVYTTKTPTQHAVALRRTFTKDEAQFLCSQDDPKPREVCDPPIFTKFTNKAGKTIDFGDIITELTHQAAEFSKMAKAAAALHKATLAQQNEIEEYKNFLDDLDCTQLTQLTQAEQAEQKL